MAGGDVLMGAKYKIVLDTLNLSIYFELVLLLN